MNWLSDHLLMVFHMYRLSEALNPMLVNRNPGDSQGRASQVPVKSSGSEHEEMAPFKPEKVSILNDERPREGFLLNRRVEINQATPGGMSKAATA